METCLTTSIMIGTCVTSAWHAKIGHIKPVMIVAAVQRFPDTGIDSFSTHLQIYNHNYKITNPGKMDYGARATGCLPTGCDCVTETVPI
ncbi:hypothetical protein PGT21_034887 [Puccinia graminis f. sp. tritici]|uniref:Uncharacterized protein n=1 Tax=Puccinia graminis f. sp. tritici TaxID=56615 RepID=A0A5B0P0J7_PUCGR|nr:hypothetical protein PGT21_034887 [Puccinia graminis f. sp. tritici]KAA1121308.1 hypothetical protein PGTUg99_002067 [Puccinia graminis f. sp. tritici]